MATRFYFPSTGAAAVSPAFDALWDNVAGAARFALVTVKTGTAPVTDNCAEVPNASNQSHLIQQYISGPLPAQTISGNVKGQFRGVESDASRNANGEIVIRVFSNDGSTERGTLRSTTFGTEFPTSTPQNRALPDAAVTPLAISAGDRIVVDIGTNIDGSISSGENAGIVFEDTNADLPEDSTTTTDQSPWIEFSADLFPAAVRAWILE